MEWFPYVVFGMLAAAAIALIVKAVLGQELDQRGIYRVDDPRRWDGGRRSRRD